MSSNPFSLLSSAPTAFAPQQDANPDPNSKPKPSAAAKKKRNLPGNPGENQLLDLDRSSGLIEKGLDLYNFCCFLGCRCRSGCGGHRSIAEVSHGDEQIHLRNMQQGVSERSEPAASPTRAQSAVEAAAADKQGADQEEGVYLPGEDVRPPRPVAGPWRPHRNKETLQPETRREEVEMR